MTNVWCVRADSGQFAEHFLCGGYAGIGWSEITQDLGTVRSREELYPLVRAAYSDVHSSIVIGNYVGQIARFLMEIRWGLHHHAGTRYRMVALWEGRPRPFVLLLRNRGRLSLPAPPTG